MYNSITMNEWLPLLVGTGFNGLSTYSGYNKGVEPRTTSHFISGAFRIFHSMVNCDIVGTDSSGRRTLTMPLTDTFFNNAWLSQSTYTSLMNGLAFNPSKFLDVKIVDPLRDASFPIQLPDGSTKTVSLDLFAVDVMRGRDQGLVGYNMARIKHGLSRLTNFNQLTTDSRVQQQLQSIYPTIDDVDVMVGLSLEEPIASSSPSLASTSLAGELTTAIIVRQMQKLRDGDRCWYESQLSASPELLRSVQNTRIIDMVTRTMDLSTVPAIATGAAATRTRAIAARRPAQTFEVEVEVAIDPRGVVTNAAEGRRGLENARENDDRIRSDLDSSDGEALLAVGGASAAQEASFVSTQQLHVDAETHSADATARPSVHQHLAPIPLTPLVPSTRLPHLAMPVATPESVLNTVGVSFHAVGSILHSLDFEAIAAADAAPAQTPTWDEGPIADDMTMTATTRSPARLQDRERRSEHESDQAHSMHLMSTITLTDTDRERFGLSGIPTRQFPIRRLRDRPALPIRLPTAIKARNAFLLPQCRR